MLRDKDTLFQSTLPREERLALLATQLPTISISIHAPTRGATLLYAFCYILRNFNPRSHERSDSFIRIRFPGLEYFNPRSHERSDQSACPCSRHSRNFNPRSHERSDKDLENYVNCICISIHAPTRGATC